MITKNSKKRFHESALSKRKALLEISRGKNPKEVILNKTESKDKKYSNKMLYKWKKEAFSKIPDIQNNGFGNDFCNIDIEYELGAFQFSENIEILLNTKKTHKDFINDCFAVFSDDYLLYPVKQ